jgi:3-mercaptopropionate dioxygenase
MPQHDLPAPLQRFVDAVNRLLETESEESCLHPRVGDAMGELVARDDWLDPAFAQPHPQYYQEFQVDSHDLDHLSRTNHAWH